MLGKLRSLPGCVGWIVLDADGRQLGEWNADEQFPLASAAKLAIGEAIASKVEARELTWDTQIFGLVFDPREDSHVLYPHLQGQRQYTLRRVVEVMIACHDQSCANAIANRVGGWRELSHSIACLAPAIHVDSEPRSESRNIGRLDAMVGLVQRAITGFQTNCELWEPIVAGLVRQADKTAGIPSYRQWNMTGGLPHALIDVGLS
ncbi:MAG: serine hydrolase [Bacilli bacterium]